MTITTLGTGLFGLDSSFIGICLGYIYLYVYYDYIRGFGGGGITLREGHGLGAIYGYYYISFGLIGGGLGGLTSIRVTTYGGHDGGIICESTGDYGYVSRTLLDKKETIYRTPIGQFGVTPLDTTLGYIYYQ